VRFELGDVVARQRGAALDVPAPLLDLLLAHRVGTGMVGASGVRELQMRSRASLTTAH
jgi:hypothetical protein